jgi:hypothetical protein
MYFRKRLKDTEEEQATDRNTAYMDSEMILANTVVSEGL